MCASDAGQPTLRIRRARLRCGLVFHVEHRDLLEPGTLETLGKPRLDVAVRFVSRIRSRLHGDPIPNAAPRCEWRRKAWRR